MLVVNDPFFNLADIGTQRRQNIQDTHVTVRRLQAMEASPEHRVGPGVGCEYPSLVAVITFFEKRLCLEDGDEGHFNDLAKQLEFPVATLQLLALAEGCIEVAIESLCFGHRQ